VIEEYDPLVLRHHPKADVYKNIKAAPPTTAARPGPTVTMGAAACKTELEAAAAELEAAEALDEAELRTALETEARAEERAALFVERAELSEEACEAMTEEAALEMEL